LTVASLEWDLPGPFTIELEVMPADIDGLQHTNNAVYVKWCERAAWTHSESLGLDLARYQQLSRAMAITRSEFDYLAASRLGDKISVATWITNWDGKLTMQRCFQVQRIDDGITLLRGRMKFACIDLESGKARRMPPEFIEGYGKALTQT
jgi:acyl-CoA thioester hydrolase